MWDMRRAPDGSLLATAEPGNTLRPHRLDDVDEEALLSTIDAPVTIHRVFIEICGNLNAAAVLTDLSFLEREAPTPDDWVEVPQGIWLQRLGLSAKEQVTARRLLKDRGFIEEQRTGLPPRLMFRIDWRRVDRAIRDSAARRVAGRSTSSLS